MKRLYANAAFGSGSFIGLILWLLDMIGRAQTAYDVAAVTIQKVIINWGVVYFCVFVVCTGFLIAINFDLILLFLVARKEAKNPVLDEALVRAANQIVGASNTRHSFNYSHRFEETASLIEANAKNGTIIIAGKANVRDALRPITKKEWQAAALRWQTKTADYEQFSDFWLVESNNPKTVLMRGLMVNFSQIHSAIT